MSGQYALGLDYGTLSVRALLVDVDTGQEKATAVYEYPHGVMESELPDGIRLPKNFALADPEDYLEGLVTTVQTVMKDSGVAREQVIGIGLDATSATVLPVNEDGTPLCMIPQFRSHPHAYIKLWKHHGAIAQADALSQAAQLRGEKWLPYFGNWISSELFVPKTVETAVCDPEVYQHCYSFLEVADWLTWVLTDENVRSSCMASCNSLYRYDTGYPSEEFFGEAVPQAAHITEKYRGKMIPLGKCAGRLSEAMAERLGLIAGTPVGAAIVDSHASVVGCGSNRPGDLVAVIGTSACYLMNSETGEGIPGIYSAAYEAHVPGLFGYEGGQPCVGDCFGWFVNNCMPEKYRIAARAENRGIHSYLQEKAEQLKPGESGLLALDWWNGMRTPLMDPKLTGVLVGLTFHTKPEEIYRALIEAVCFGARRIIETYETAGHPVKRLFVTGGIPAKNAMMMQMMADICGRELLICGSTQSGALGSAVLGAMAAGAGDFDSLTEKMCVPPSAIYHVIPKNREIYEKLYIEYKSLAEFFSTQSNILRNLRRTLE